MLTRKQFVPPTLAGNWNVDGPNLLKAINDYWLALNGKSALEIDEARIRAAQGILFPATKVASSDVNTLDDYNEVASSSPVVASGTGAITSYTSTLTETKIGNRVLFELTIAVTNNGTGATNIQVTMPDAAAALAALSAVVTGGGPALGAYINGATIFIYKYDGTYPIAGASTIVVAGEYRI
jgi:hypothetical protein